MRWILDCRFASLLAVLLACPLPRHRARAAQPVAWSGEAAYRLLVEVPPQDLGGRASDVMPAEVPIDGAGILSDLGVAGTVDVASLQVVRYDAASGQPISGSTLVDARSPFDCPFRWYDGSIPYRFPEFAGNIDQTHGVVRRTPVPRAGYFYNAIGDWKRGRLAWVHEQHGRAPSHYAIYFNRLPDGVVPAAIPPRGWIGDGLPRCAAMGTSTMGTDHCRLDLDDWDGDGLIDLIVGEAAGHVFWWRNCGTRSAPKFPYAKFLFDADGLPIDVGSSAAPKVVDWDRDGAKDLLVGAEWNRILLFRNQGTNTDRRLKYAGFLRADGDVLMLPIRPMVRGSSDIFKRDYYPVLETIDWDGDGDLDLLAGGYITGRIFWYENLGEGEDGLPRLAFRGPLEADGRPLNVVHWCAAPCAADFDADGDVDLISGNMPITTSGGDAEGAAAFLRYYENSGTRHAPRLKERPFPSTGTFPQSRLATPRAADWDGDGDLDLIVSARADIFLFRNDGGPSSPRFAAHAEPLRCQWGTARIPGDQIVDYNGDGRPDLFTRAHYTVRINAGHGNPWTWEKTIAILPAGKFISHPSRIGDDWFWPYLTDFDQDGRFDILFGDWFGHVWLHRNRSTRRERDFDMQGEKLKLNTGEPIRVGPIGQDITTDFGALQGARTVLAVADFDRDRLPDLVIGDTYGKVRVFRQVGTLAKPVFAKPLEVGDLGIRLLVDTTDWNQDGWPDIIAGAANGRVRVFVNRGSGHGLRFMKGIDPSLPAIPQPRVLVWDLNGDGDEDFFLPSTQGSFFVERSFLEHGYARGSVVRVERRP